MEDTLNTIFQFMGVDNALFLKPVNKQFYNAIHNSYFITSHIQYYNPVLTEIMKNKGVDDTIELHRHYIRFREYEFIMDKCKEKMKVENVLELCNSEETSITGLRFADYWKLLRSSYYLVQIQCSNKMHGSRAAVDAWLNLAMDFFTKQLLIYCFMGYYDTIKSIAEEGYQFGVIWGHYGDAQIQKTKTSIESLLDLIADATSLFDHENLLVNSIYTGFSRNNVVVHLAGKIDKEKLMGKLFVSLSQKNKQTDCVLA